MIGCHVSPASSVRKTPAAEMATKIFAQGDVSQKALTDFDQLLSQKNYRQIYENSPRFIAACALYPERQKQLSDILDVMKAIGLLIEWAAPPDEVFHCPKVCEAPLPYSVTVLALML